MPEIPEAMRRNGRPKDQVFADDERLYRRVPLELWDDPSDEIELDAIALPDMSVMRGKYAHPEWVRLEDDSFSEWGVVYIVVQFIPASILHAGVFKWTFKVLHVPLDAHPPRPENYPHSEVHAFEDNIHVNAKAKIDPDMHLRWREHVHRNLKKIINPHQRVEVCHEAPSLS